MFENHKEDLSGGEISFSMLSLLSSKLRVGIIGAGKGGYIKAKHLLERGCYVEVLSIDYEKKFEELLKYNLKIIRGEYNKSFILDKHLIIIVIDNDEDIRRIEHDCNSLYKIYINSKSFTEGMGAIPVQKDMKNFILGISSKGGNPKGSLMMGEKAENYLKKYDDFIGYTTSIRNKAKKFPNLKKSITNFMASEDFFFFFEKGKENVVLKLFYEDDMILYER
ncbi:MULTISPECIES: NAD(P)-dependent oxidoreductase [Clostridium]|uniref:precorrin-2 dehydrogenase n=1 Tax=Clostridium cibarium TaxID=2762247 RepID=A0ABR8PU18_9CLOT|nr:MULTISPECIES: NAD(P)-dependent oxidoreductase [Clostridium]MBD7911657.1 NAD(P)-dependent oxidoreductase [Clostridium cibarium]